MKFFMLLLLVAATTCTDTKDTDQVDMLTKISLSSGTRGGQKNISLTKDTLLSVINANTQQAALAPADWAKIVASLEGVAIAKIEGLEQPSDGHQSDRAWASNLTIETGEGAFTTSTFDNLNAPTPLQPLVAVMNELHQKYFETPIF